MLKYGTKTRSRKDIADQLDKIKTSISFYGNTNTLYASINTDKANFNAAMDLLQDMLLNPSFDEKEYDKLMLDAKADLETRMSDPMTVASEALTKKMNLYPDEHPYHPESAAEQLATIKNVKLSDIKSFYNDFYGSNNGYASFVGGLDANEVKGQLDQRFSKWNSKKPFTDIEEKYFEIKGGVEIVQIDDKTNAGMLGGMNIRLTQKDPDFVPLTMANEMLGGGAFLSSRIPQRLREAEGMSYGAGSFYDAGYKYPSGSLGLYAIFNPAYREKLNAALEEEMKKAIASGFTEEEWKSSLASWLQQRKIYLDNNNALVSMLNNYMFDGKDLNFYTEMESKAKDLKVAQINEALKKHVDMTKLVLIYAGDFKKSEP
jgi:zinc protease